MDNPNLQKTHSTISTLDSGPPPNGTVYGAERPKEMAMISNTERANITHSQLTMAGNNVNNYSVNIMLTSRPSYSRRRVPRDRPVPYSRPEPSSESSSGIRSGSPSTRTMVNDIVSEKGKATDFTNSQTASSANTVHRLSGNMEIASLHHLEIDAHLAKTAGPVRMPHEIYVKQLYACGQGYPCANPKPWGETVKMGDIGLLSDGEFVVLENLYALPDSFLQDEPAPVIPTVSDRNVLAEGDTITGGIDDCTLKMSDKYQNVEEITMQCHQEEGAALVITSPAELQKMSNNDPLRQYLHRNGPRLFELLHEKHRFAQNSSLYIVTGTILSASWAIATHGRPMKAPHNILALKRYLGNENRKPFWAWTHRASAQVRIGGTGASNKDQCLFLRGFLITPSSPDRQRHRRISRQADLCHPLYILIIIILILFSHPPVLPPLQGCIVLPKGANRASTKNQFTSLDFGLAAIHNSKTLSLSRNSAVRLQKNPPLLTGHVVCHRDRQHSLYALHEYILHKMACLLTTLHYREPVPSTPHQQSVDTKNGSYVRYQPR